jgi:hypothetical protein
MHRQDVLVDQVELAERRDERGSIDQPDVTRRAMAQFLDTNSTWGAPTGALRVNT